MADSKMHQTATAPVDTWVQPSYAADVSVIIVNYNTRAMLKRSLETLLSSQQSASMEVIVVDNASHDGSSQMVELEFPTVRCLANTANLGHTGGCNQGMQAARGRYLFLLNSDTLSLPGGIDTLIRYLDAHPQVGAAAGKVLNADGSLQGTLKRFPTPLAAIFGRKSWLTKLFPRNRFSRRYLLYKDQDFSQPFAVDSASACALMVRREAIAGAGPMDPRYFLYWNDVDWCRAIWRSGYEVHCVPESVIIHDQHRGGTRAGAKQIIKSTYDFHLGAYRYYRKWHIPRPWHPKHLGVIALLTARAAVVMVIDEVQYFIRRRRAPV